MTKIILKDFHTIATTLKNQDKVIRTHTGQFPVRNIMESYFINTLVPVLEHILKQEKHELSLYPKQTKEKKAKTKTNEKRKKQIFNDIITFIEQASKNYEKNLVGLANQLGWMEYERKNKNKFLKNAKAKSFFNKLKKMDKQKSIFQFSSVNKSSYVNSMDKYKQNMIGLLNSQNF